MSGAETLLTSAAPDGPVIGVAIVDEGGASVRMIDSSGWREAITGSTYVLTDPNGNTVTKRRATTRDQGRIRALLGL